jgi:inosine/guanosine/xanthosine phosphorylase family protein
MTDDLLDSTLPYLRGRGVPEARVAIILGTGFGLIEREVKAPLTVPYATIPGMPRPAGTSGHECRLTAGKLWGVPALVFRGRYHAYEGHPARDLVAPVRLARGLGADTLIVTNAAGGIRDDLQPGTLMAIRDHLNLLGINPLTGPERMPGARRFPPMAGAYDPELTATIQHATGDVPPGVYAAVPGPSFETAAEVNWLRQIGADAVGMSTVPEVIAARALGMRVCGLSLITNRAGSTDDSHERTIKSGHENGERVAAVIREVVRAISRGA